MLVRRFIALLTAWTARNPKDSVFAVYGEFGPSMAIDRFERLRAEFPAIDERTIRDWLADFKLVGEEIWSIAKEGGPQTLGDATVRTHLQARFPFLVGRGLKKACYLAAYDTWHEGFDRKPEPQ